MKIILELFRPTIFDRFLEGGVLFMSLILICLLLSIYFIVKSFSMIKTNTVLSKKMLAHINDSGVLGLTLGFFGAFIGLIAGFDAVEASGQGEPAIIAGAIKIGLLSPLFGLFTFAISRFGILLLRLFQKDK
ncbi:MAG: hypothetical protein ABGW56_05025 [Flavobacteriaceae bacterium]|jgi:hypothetical protein